MAKISELVWLWVKQRPHVQEALEKRIVNHSALARVINREIKGSDEAIKMALIRIARKLRKKKKYFEKRILSILRDSTLEVRSKIAIVVSRKRIEGDFIAEAKVTSGYVYVVEESDLRNIKKKGIIEVEKNLDLIRINSPKEIEKIPGVTSYLLDSLSSENINLQHIIACHRDTLMITSEVDTPETFKILSEKLR